ncbi:hypothetical protein KEM54_003137 [Ascosphaera aggregata]|nr:hypothetical protein KEM54_003137 [Ascosphaera aggregata]
MAKDKERTLNPVQAQRKSEKQKAVKKGKAEQQVRRNEKLARRNPARLERQINDLKAIEAPGGRQLAPHEKQRLADLERDLKAVLKAREALGDAAPQFTGARRSFDGGDSSRLGKRQRGENSDRSTRHDDSSETDEDVRNIPMPRDKSPPIPREYWQRRRQRREAMERRAGGDKADPDKSLPPKPAVVVESKAVYEAAPEIRDLRKEATTRFVPTAVRQKKQEISGAGGRLLEPEEMNKLEKAGYLPTATAATAASPSNERQAESRTEPAVSESFDADIEALHNLNQAHVEDVEDEEL